VTAGDAEHLSIPAVLRDTAAVYRRHWTFLVPAAVVVLLPQSLVDTFLDGLNVEGIGSAKEVAIVAAVPLTVAVNLLGQAIYAGLTAAAVVDWRAGMPLPPIGTLFRSLPIVGLILLDLVMSAGIAIGAVLAVLPGLAFLAYFGISPAVMKFERRGVISSMRRSAQLVRGNFWRVFALVVVLIVFAEATVAAITFPFHDWASLALVELAAHGLLQPIEGLVIVLVTLQLLALRGEAPEPRTLARALTHAAK
jgi:hypothetical protein